MDLIANADKDLAVVIKLKTAGIDTALLVQELNQVLKIHHANYELELIERDKQELDFIL